MTTVHFTIEIEGTYEEAEENLKPEDEAERDMSEHIQKEWQPTTEEGEVSTSVEVTYE